MLFCQHQPYTTLFPNFSTNTEYLPQVLPDPNNISDFNDTTVPQRCSPSFHGLVDNSEVIWQSLVYRGDGILKRDRVLPQFHCKPMKHICSKALVFVLHCTPKQKFIVRPFLVFRVRCRHWVRILSW
jgi:hypothetical protein